MRAATVGAVRERERERERESYTLENKSAVCLSSLINNSINQKNKYRSILYLCNFAMQKTHRCNMLFCVATKNIKKIVAEH